MKSANTIEVNKDAVRFIGRNYEDAVDSNVYFSNTFAGIEFSFYGTSVEAEVLATSYANKYEPFVKAYIDDMKPIDIKIVKKGWYVLAQGLDIGNHNVRLVKRNEANTNAVAFSRLRIDQGGKFLPPFENKTDRKILILGDSICCGFGSLYKGEQEFGITEVEDGCQTYGVIAADILNAQAQVVAVSGIGVARNAGGDNQGTMLDLFRSRDMRCGYSYNFEEYVPDVVIVGMGVNDDGGEATKEEFIKASDELIDNIRESYSNAFILWVYGIMGCRISSWISELIESRIKNGDERIYYHITKPDTEDEGVGLYGHPTVKTHIRIADELVSIIKKAMNWN